MKVVSEIVGILSIFIILTNFNEVKLQSFKFCNDSLGYCVPSTICANQTVLTDGTGLLDIRFSLNDVNENDECHYLETCCDPENIIGHEESQPQTEDNGNEDSLSQCIQQCQAADSMHKTPPPITNANIVGEPLAGCGLRNKYGVGLQLTQSADVAQFGEFPWHLALKERRHAKFWYICGASLIHPQVALTSAHCVHEKHSSNLRIRAGEWDTQTINEPFPHSDFNVIQIVTHPDFDSKSLAYDIALVVLETPVKLTAHVNTICLPPRNSQFNNQTCFATGWGRDNFHNENAYRVNLKKLQLPVVPQKNCQDNLRRTKLGDKFKLHPSFMCAGGVKGVDTCIGDGGSALICGIPGETDYYYQAGIVTWGIECGMEGVPGIYVNVGKFRDWIDNEMENLEFGSKSYTF